MRFLYSFLLIAFVHTGWCQLGTTTQNPGHIRWSQKKTPHFQIIFPAGYDSVSNRLANTLEAVYEPVSKTLGKKPRRIPLVLQTQTTVSNGFVSLSPRYTEFFITPPQDANFLGNNRWLDLLAVHEYRHVVQNEQAMTGITQGLYYLLGYNAINFMKLGLPDWFSEGDAVSTETALTQGGRGRIPEFNLLQRTQWTTLAKPFSYSKAVAGSYKDAVPDWYVLGYHLTNQARRTHGAEVWNETLRRFFNFPLYPFSFSDKLKKTTGSTVETLYQETIRDFKTIWKSDSLSPTPATSVPASIPSVYTDYVTPQFLSDGSLVALKSGLADIPAFVVLNGSVEKKLYETGFINASATLSASDSKIVWVEQHPDVRWGMRDYTVIKIFDTKTRQKTQITARSRYFAPALSPDGTQIIAVELDTQGNSSLVLLNSADGQVIRKFPNPGSFYYQQPRFAKDGDRIVVVKQQGSLKTLEIVSVSTGDTQEVFNESVRNLAQPVLHDNWLIFNAPHQETDQIYAVNLDTKKLFLVTRRPFGAYHAAVSPDGQTLAFQDFTAKGFRIATVPFTPDTWQPLDEVPMAPTRSFGPLVQQENASPLQTLPTNQNFQTRKYSRANLFNIYGWGPLFYSNTPEITVGIESQNLLSTAFTTAGYGYNANERQSRWYGNFSYYGWYPVIDIGIQSAGRSTTIPIDRQSPIDSIRTNQWRQNELNIGVRLPLVFTHSKYRESMSVGVQANLIQTQGYTVPARYRTEPGSYGLAATTFSAAYSRLLRQAKRDVQPRWGQYFSIYSRNTPFGGFLHGNLLALQSRLYFPGLAKHHSLRLFGGVQFQGSADNYAFGSPLLFPRGYAYSSATQLMTSSVQYQLPVAYPDWSLGRLLYFQRIKVNGFMDLAHAVNRTQSSNFTADFRSFGVDLSVDFNFLRLRQSFEAGVRLIWTADQPMIIQPLIIDIGF